MSLDRKTCIPCRAGEPPLTTDEIAKLLPQVPDWQVATEEGHPVLMKSFKFTNFAGSMVFANKVKDIAESEGHHPDLHIHWDTVRVVNWTHATGGLHQNDFILAAKIDRAFGL